MKTMIVLFTLMLSSFLVHAQKYYAVMVSDAKTATPLVGVSIKVLSTGTTVNTSKSGNVVIIASPDDSIHVKFKGYKERKISLVNQSQAISIVIEAIPKPVGIKPKKIRN